MRSPLKLITAAPTIVRAVASSWIAMGVAILAQGISIPLYLHYLSKEAFGIVMMWSAFSTFGAFGIGGIWHGGMQFLGEQVTRGDHARFVLGYRVIRMAMLIYAALMIGLMIVLIQFSHGLDRSEVTSIPVLFACLYSLLSARNSVDRIALFARAEIVFENYTSIVTQLVFIFLLPVMLAMHVGISSAPAAYCCGLVAAQLLIRQHWRAKKIILASVRKSGRADSQSVLHFIIGGLGSQFQLQGFLSSVLAADILIMGVVGGPLLAAEFALLWKLADVSILVLGRIPDALQPLLIQAATRGDDTTFRSRYFWGQVFVASAAAIGGISYALFGRWFVELWVNSENAPTAPNAFLYAGIALFFVAVSRLSKVACMARKAVGILNITMAIELVAKIGLTILLLDSHGATSPLLGWVYAHVLGIAAIYQFVGVLSLSKERAKLMSLRRLWIRIHAACQLGLWSILQVMCYRLCLRFGYWERRMPEMPCPSEGIWRNLDLHPAEAAPELDPTQQLAVKASAQELLDGKIRLFGRDDICHRAPINWSEDPESLLRWPNAHDHWTRIQHFGAKFDIKNIWDVGRFWWAPQLAAQARLSDSTTALATLRNWTRDFAENNAVNVGPQWSCGQETSIRAVNLLLAARILGQDVVPEHGLVEMIVAHARRIRPTILYAIGQMDNHAISEAAALLVVGEWLCSLPLQYKVDRSEAHEWTRKGRQVLEDMVAIQIAPDGCHVQRSLCYQRVVLDTLSVAEAFRARFNAAPFSRTFYAKARAAAEFLFHFVEPQSGRTPLLGAIDGSRGYDLSFLGIDDYRPAVQFAMVLFGEGAPFPEGPWDVPLQWFGIDINRKIRTRRSRIFSSSGYAFVSAGRTWGALVLPHYRIRAAHADGLHLDIWQNGRNWATDGGTISYYRQDSAGARLEGVWGHNTISFDGEDQMVKVSRFLYAGWPKRIACEFLPSAEGVALHAEMTDWQGRRHNRRIDASDRSWTITDSAMGHADTARIQWLLHSGIWTQATPNTWRTEGASISLLNSGGPKALSLSTVPSGYYYGDVRERPALSGTAKVPAAFVTRMEFHDHSMNYDKTNA